MLSTRHSLLLLSLLHLPLQAFTVITLFQFLHILYVLYDTIHIKYVKIEIVCILLSAANGVINDETMIQPDIGSESRFMSTPPAVYAPVKGVTVGILS